MKIKITCTNSNIVKKFVLDKHQVDFTDEAIRLPVKRKGTNIVVERVWFPLSQVSYSLDGPWITVSISEWLYKKKVGDSFTIGN